MGEFARLPLWKISARLVYEKYRNKVVPQDVLQFSWSYVMRHVEGLSACLNVFFNPRVKEPVTVHGEDGEEVEVKPGRLRIPEAVVMKVLEFHGARRVRAAFEVGSCGDLQLKESKPAGAAGGGGGNA